MTKINDSNSELLNKSDNCDMEVLEVREIVWLYVLPVLCLTGVVTNLLNIVVFSNKRLKFKIYRLMLIHSVIDFIYLTLSFVYFLVIRRSYLYESLSPKHNRLIMLIYDLVCIRLLCTIIAVFSIFIELTISFNLLAIIENNCNQIRFLGRYFPLLVTAFASLAIFTQVPFILSIRITSDNIGSYMIEASEHSDIVALKVLNSSFSIFRGIIAPLIQLALNINIIVAYKRQMRSKLLMTLIDKTEGIICVSIF